MLITIELEYRTIWGEELYLSGNIAELGHFKIDKMAKLYTNDGVIWKLNDLQIANAQKIISYKYVVVKDGRIVREEQAEQPHQIDFRENSKLLIKDVWIDVPQQTIELYDIYNNVWKSGTNQKALLKLSQEQTNLIFESTCPQLNNNEQLVLCGNIDELGNWNPKKALKLTEYENSKFKAIINGLKVDCDIEYKYLILNRDKQKVKYWEKRENRTICNSTIDKHRDVVINDGYINFPSKERWKGAGVTVPIFSLRSKKSYGIGEFTDLKIMADWASKVGLKIIQILPINDTISTKGWADSYPYRCSSVFALNPIYIDLEELGILSTKYAKNYRTEQEELNSLKFINYPKVIQHKLKYLKHLYKIDGSKIEELSDYKIFISENKNWLLSYASYLYFRAHYKTSDTTKWGKNMKYSSKDAKELQQKNREANLFFKYIFYIQYNLHLQLKKASEYTQTRGIALKGDLPIGISKQSVDAWQHPMLFNLNSQAGAPPDDFAAQGQNWGFPTYNWKQMHQEHYKWWKDRLKHMNQFYDAYRIDHILGFFRIWSIPENAIYGTLGQFDPALPYNEIELKELGLQKETIISTPYITEETINTLCKGNKNLVTHIITTYLYKDKYTYSFNELFDTQRKIAESNIPEEDKAILQDLHAELLFVPDIENKMLYHPRIDAEKTFTFSTLSKEQQSIYLKIYTDFFYYRHNSFWEKEAVNKLPELINSSDMLVCGEDLGMIPATVPEVMNRLSILSLEVTRMPKKETEFIGNPLTYPYFSISTFSTHDMSTLKGWWSKNKALGTLLIEHLSNKDLEYKEKLSEDMAFEILLYELQGNSILCIEALQDWLSLSDKYNTLLPEEEQINIPSEPNHQWKYRMPCFIEDLIEDSKLNKTITELLKLTNRNL